MFCQGVRMTSRYVRLADQDTQVRTGLREVRDELDIPHGFSAEVLRAADEAARDAGRQLARHRDATDIPFVTIDPAGSMDLDQAVHVTRTATGFLVSYAIADVAAFATSGGPVDTEARRRGLTLYAPDGRVPLHPMILSEGAASLLPDRDRPAVLWRLAVDEQGRLVSTDVFRAVVRSRAQLSYTQVQDEFDRTDRGGTTDDMLVALREVGLLRQQQERLRGGIDLPVPEQVVTNVDGSWQLCFRAPQAVEGWNAQISLLTGMAAAELMLAGGVGILRTMPPPQESDLARVRRTAMALGLTWPANGSYADLIRSADPEQPAHLAFLSLATTLLRGAGYTAFEGDAPELTTHSAVAAPYAHVTAPLRRLVDRFGTEVALSVCAGREIPDWAVSALSGLPDLMMAATRKSRALERESINLIEAVLLQDRVGERFSASVVDRDTRNRDNYSIVIRDPGVRAKAKGNLKVGTQAEVVLEIADPHRRLVRFHGDQGLTGD